MSALSNLSAIEAPIDPDLLDSIRARAGALDALDGTTRDAIRDLGARGLLGLGAPVNSDGELPAMVGVLKDLASECLSTAFSVWAHRMSIEYLAVAGTNYALEQVTALRTGDAIGVTGMASAFKDLAGCGSLDLTATKVEGGYRVSGPLRWASNLFDDALVVSAARVDTGDKLVFATPLRTEGLTAGAPFSLLALGSTASSSVTFDDVFIPDAQVLSTDPAGFLGPIRPTFLSLQTAFCVGLAGKCLSEARTGLLGVNTVFTAELDTLDGRHGLLLTTLLRLAESVGSEQAPQRKELLAMRLAAAELATAAAGLEVRTAGGRAYASRTPTSRRYREATFIPVQSPSEGQLRWELASA